MSAKKTKINFGKLLSFLRVRTTVGGLEITDQALRLAYQEKEKTWRFAAVALGPGVMERGTVKDAAALGHAFQELRAKVPSLRRRGKKMNVVVSLGSASVYTQSFTLPIVGGAELKKAIDLNIRMSAPDDLAKSYFGSRVLTRDDAALRFEIGTAFIDRTIVDGLVPVLFGAGFVATDIESRALSLARTVRERTVLPDAAGSYLLLDIDDTGIDFLVLRKGELYFEYATRWADIADPKGQVTMDRFNETVVANFRQVSNFYHQRWQNPLGGVIVVAAAFGEAASAAIAPAASGAKIPVIPPSFAAGQEIESEWFAAYGAALRDGLGDEISLSGDVASDAYHKEQVLSFLEFWRVLVPVTLGILVATLAVANNFLGGVAVQASENSAAGQVGGQSQLLTEISSLEASSTAFNHDVQVALAAQSAMDKSHTLFDTLEAAAKSSSVTLSRVSFEGTASPVSLSGVASTADDIVQFKDLLAQNSEFTGVNLPLSDIQPSGSMYSFTMTFSIAGGVFK